MYWAEQLAAKTAHTVSICIIKTSYFFSVCTLYFIAFRTRYALQRTNFKISNENQILTVLKEFILSWS